MTIAIAGLVFGKEAAQQSIMTQMESLVGPQSAAAVKQMLDVAQKPSSGLLASFVALGTLLLGASGVFAQLQDALNTVWGRRTKGRPRHMGCRQRPLLLSCGRAWHRLFAFSVLSTECGAGGFRQTIYGVAARPRKCVASGELCHFIWRHHAPVRDDV
jgi:hypothetical protein